MLEEVKHLGHASIKIENIKIVYIDPFNIKNPKKDADLIFCTHSHYDHLSIKDIKLISKDSTKLIVPSEAIAAAKESKLNIVEVEPNKSYTIDSVSFSTVPAYNIGKSFHPKSKNWVGYIIFLNNTTYYHSGDTDFIPEMKNIKADIIFLPVGGTYTMNWKEAAEAANTISCSYAIPIHFGDIVGSKNDAQNFVNEIRLPRKGIILIE